MAGYPLITRTLQRLSWLILALVALSLTISLIVLLVALHREQTKQRKELQEDLVWYVTQTEHSAMTFLDAVHRFRELQKPTEQNEVRTTFTAFKKRVDALDKGDIGSFFLKLPGAEAGLRRIRKLLVQVKPLIPDLADYPAASTNAIVTAMRSALPSLHDLARQSAEFDLHRLRERHDRFKRLYLEALLLLSGATLAGVTLIVLILRQQKTLNTLTGKLEQQLESQSQDLKASHQRLTLLSQAVEQSPASVLICDQDGNIEYVNPQFETITGYRAEEVLGANPRLFKSGKTPASTYEFMWRELRAGRQWRGELCNRRKNGELYWEQISISPIIDEESGTRRYLAVKEDITRRKLYEEHLFRQANYDSLTQLPNRALALDRLEQAIRRAKRHRELAGLLFIDLDNFKEINDTLGHDAGDLLLHKVAQRLAGCLRECDTAARYGGDEFIAILSELNSREDARQILERILTAFSKPFDLVTKTRTITTSIGVSFSPDDGNTPAELLKKADAAMYLVKSAGKKGYKMVGEEPLPSSPNRLGRQDSSQPTGIKTN